MDILILGNGFDLAHELKTKYSDFLEYCKNEYQKYLSIDKSEYARLCRNNIWIKHFITRQRVL